MDSILKAKKCPSCGWIGVIVNPQTLLGHCENCSELLIVKIEIIPDSKLPVRNPLQEAIETYENFIKNRGKKNAKHPL